MNTQKTVLNKIAQLSKIQEVELASKQELASEKVELATVNELIDRAKEGRKMANKAKMSIDQLKSQAKITADAIDNFANGPYFDVVNEAVKIRAKAKELGFENSSEIKELDSVVESISNLRLQLGNGMASDWYKAISKL